MKVMGPQGLFREKKVTTTNPDKVQPCLDDKVNRAFMADLLNQRWVGIVIDAGDQGKAKTISFARIVSFRKQGTAAVPIFNSLS